jgi:hypothetical protein
MGKLTRLDQIGYPGGCSSTDTATGTLQELFRFFELDVLCE